MFTIISGGYHSRHPASFSMNRPSGDAAYLLLSIKSEAVFFLNDEEYSIEPNSVIVIDRNSPYRYHNPYGEYLDDWIHFDCHDDYTFHKMELKFNQFFRLTNPLKTEQYIEQILWEKQYAAPKYQNENATLLFKVLLNQLIDKMVMLFVQVLKPARRIDMASQ